ncbi:MAG TPA: hypothetical protein VGL59_22075 [Polyangia bacterium]
MTQLAQAFGAAIGSHPASAVSIASALAISMMFVPSVARSSAPPSGRGTELFEPLHAAAPSETNSRTMLGLLGAAVSVTIAFAGDAFRKTTEVPLQNGRRRRKPSLSFLDAMHPADLRDWLLKRLNGLNRPPV